MTLTSVQGPPTWTILIPTLGQRQQPFQRLLDVLLPQVDAANGLVRVLAYWNNGELPLATIRQTLVESVTSDYLCFVDDDDMVPPYYVEEVTRALASRPQYVGWQVAYYSDGVFNAICYHSLRHGGWWNENDAYYRDISHVNPMQTAIARMADFRKARRYRAEDRVWVDQLRGRLATEVYIDRVMYHYYYAPRASAWQRPVQIRRGRHQPIRPGSPYFAYHRRCAAWAE